MNSTPCARQEHLAASAFTPGSKRRATLRPSQRLQKSALFRQTYDQGRRWSGRVMVLWRREGPGAAMRLGVVASRKNGNAVARAKARRLLREVFRRNRWRFSGAYDVILVARPAILRAHWPAIEQELLRLAYEAGLAGKDNKAMTAMPGME